MEKTNLIYILKEYWKPLAGIVGVIFWLAKIELRQRVHKDLIDEVTENSAGNTKDIVDLKVNTFTRKDAKPLFKGMNDNGKSLARIEGYLSKDRRR